MRLPSPAAFATDRALRRAALAVALIVGAVLLAVDLGALGRNVGDPDDALRLSIVRDLLHGRGWFDQRVARLQPPYGTFMHWSRLLDGGLAATDRLFGLVLPPAWAELATRALWPLFWIFPAALAVLALARRLATEQARARPGEVETGSPSRTRSSKEIWSFSRTGKSSGGLAVLIGTGLLLLDMPLYGQFRPGRIDHHDVQITLCMLALAGAVGRGAGLRGALGAGLATGLGLAIGLEALPFEAAIGAGLALEFAADRNAARRAGAYGLGLAGMAAAAFLLQTPPSRWGVSVCDALGVNLTLALLAAGVGLFVAARLTPGCSWRVRLAGVAAAGLVALALYLALKPSCIHGAFAEVDPRLRPFWFDHVNELASIGLVLKRKTAEGLGLIAAALIGFAALGGLAWFRRGEGRFDPAIGVLAACLLLATVTGFAAERMSIYILWFAAPPAAAVLAEAWTRKRASSRQVLLRAGLVAAPLAAAGVALAACGVVSASAFLPDAPDPCFDANAYAVLARQPAGVVLSEVDLGSYVLVFTRSSALSAPYHRMAWGNLSAHAALAAPVERARSRAAALHAAYVLECRAHRNHFDRVGLPGDALQRRLDAGRPPPWLEPLTPAGAPLAVYRVKG
jgi:hypothetical protein